MKNPLVFATLSLVGGSFAHASDLVLEVEIPSLAVAEYHRPYVATWIENEQKESLCDLFVWYQTEGRGEASEKGETWLKDLRKWWRVSGRDLTMPVDGVSGPTKPAGTHQIDLTAAITALPQGTYHLIVEAAREVGGRELLSIPFTWDGSILQSDPVQGSSELGTITLKQNELTKP